MSQNIIAAVERQVLCVPTTLSKRPTKVNKNQDHSKKNGHELALGWYADLDSRVEQAGGYLIDSKLRDAFNATPPIQRDAFLDSTGGYFVIWKTSGEPNRATLVCAEEIRLQNATPEEQDTRFDQMEANDE